MPKLYHKDATGISYKGENYEPDKDGAFDVPEEAVSVLTHPVHGFSTEPVEKPATKKSGGKRNAEE